MQAGNFICTQSTSSLAINVWHFIEVYSIGTNNTIVIDGVIDQSCISGRDRPGMDVVVYASSPFFPAASALIADPLYEDLAGLLLYHLKLASRGA